MRAKKAKSLNKEFGKKGRKQIVKQEKQEELKELLPKDTSHSSKKRHKNETLIDFKQRRKEANKRKRLRRKMRHATGTRTNKLSRTRS